MPHQNGGFTRNLAGLDQTAGIDVGDRRGVGHEFCFVGNTTTISRSIDRPDLNLLGFTTQQDLLLRFNFNTHNFRCRIVNRIKSSAFGNPTQ